MTTVVYEDVVDDVKKKGYACISHVWECQNMYTPSRFGIKSGAEWEIPLSNPNKIRRLVDVMNHGMEYCWMDILCIVCSHVGNLSVLLTFAIVIVALVYA
jgi:hypothetical protein